MDPSAVGGEREKVPTYERSESQIALVHLPISSSTVREHSLLLVVRVCLQLPEVGLKRSTINKDHDVGQSEGRR